MKCPNSRQAVFKAIGVYFKISLAIKRQYSKLRWLHKIARVERLHGNEMYTARNVKGT